jgi:uncharacterized protein (UPF0276 family)
MDRFPSLDAPDARPIPAVAGIGLRMPHHGAVMEQAGIGWLEVHPENYMTGGAAARALDQIRGAHALSFHAVGLSLGSADGVSDVHLRRLSELIGRYAPGLVSDHLSWSSTQGLHLPDLLPLPYSEEALAVVARNVHRAQSALQRSVLLENPSTYFEVPGGAMGEAEFLAALVRQTGCGVLLDINNIYVSACNHGVDPLARLNTYLRAVPAGAIQEIHLAGHSVQRLDEGGDIRIDDHGSHVCAGVWELYETTIAAIGARPTLIEWDTDLPALEVLQAEAAKAQAILDHLTLQEAPRYAVIG